MKKFVDKFNNISIWLLMQNNKVVGQIRWYWSKQNVCHCGMVLYTNFNNLDNKNIVLDIKDINFSKSCSTGGQGYCKRSASFEILMNKLGLECRGVGGVGEHAIERYLEEKFQVKVLVIL